MVTKKTKTKKQYEEERRNAEIKYILSELSLLTQSDNDMHDRINNLEKIFLLTQSYNEMDSKISGLGEKKTNQRDVSSLIYSILVPVSIINTIMVFVMFIILVFMGVQCI